MIYLGEHQIASAIRSKWAGSGCVVLTGVRNGVGFAKQPRTIDALAISTWPSRGLFAEGFEIKSSRSDFERELANPAKAEEIAQYCRFWWIATPVGLVKDIAAMPPNWGLVEVDEKLKCKISKPAATLEPKPMDTLFTCSVLRNFSEGYVPAEDIEALAKPRIEAAKKEAREMAGSRLKELEEGFERFHKISGINLLSDYGHIKWDLPGIAEAIATLQNMQRPAMSLSEAREALKRAADTIGIAEALFKNA